MISLLNVAKDFSFTVCVLLGLAALCVVTMAVIDRAIARFLRYRGLWPVVIKALRNHAQSLDGK